MRAKTVEKTCVGDLKHMVILLQPNFSKWTWPLLKTSEKERENLMKTMSNLKNSGIIGKLVILRWLRPALCLRIGR